MRYHICKVIVPVAPDMGDLVISPSFSLPRREMGEEGISIGPGGIISVVRDIVPNHILQFSHDKDIARDLSWIFADLR